MSDTLCNKCGGSGRIRSGARRDGKHILVNCGICHGTGRVRAAQFSGLDSGDYVPGGFRRRVGVEDTDATYPINPREDMD